MNYIKLTAIAAIFVSQLNAGETQSIKGIFADSTFEGQIRLGSYMCDFASDEKTQTVTAVGGRLKLQTASLNGISFGGAFYTSHAIDVLSGEGDRFGDYLTSSKGNYTELAEAYVDYVYYDLNIRYGRQLLDISLLDSDDVAMTPNTFEALSFRYKVEELNLEIFGANVQRMQGYDTGYTNVLSDHWMQTGDSGTNVFALLYNQNNIATNLWFYDIGSTSHIVYTDASIGYDISDNKSVTFSAQYLYEHEVDNSGVEGSIVGFMLEALYEDMVVMLAYDDLKVDNSKSIFEGFGGGNSYVNMQTTTIGTLDTDSKSFVVSLSYDISHVNIFGAYGDFEADNKDSGHLREIDAGISYTFYDDMADITLTYIDTDDKVIPSQSTDEIKLFVNYNF